MTGGRSGGLEEYMRALRDKRKKFCLRVSSVGWKAEEKKRACVVRGHMLMLGSLAGDEKKHLSVLGTPGLNQAEQIPSSSLERQPGSNRQKKTTQV